MTLTQRHPRGGWWRHARTIVLVLLAGLFGVSSAPTALAVPAFGGPIPAGETGSLRIHTRLVDSSSGGQSARPIAEVIYHVTLITGVDLRTPEGWALAHSYVGDLAAARAHVGPIVSSPPTGADGLTVVSDLAVGLYLVEVDPTTLPSATATGGRWEFTDFLVTVPILDPLDESTWVFDVEIFPKFKPPASSPTSSTTAPTTPTAPPGPLPVTGAEILTSLVVAIVLLASGGALIIIGARRTRREGRYR